MLFSGCCDVGRYKQPRLARDFQLELTARRDLFAPAASRVVGPMQMLKNCTITQTGDGRVWWLLQKTSGEEVMRKYLSAVAAEK